MFHRGISTRWINFELIPSNIDFIKSKQSSETVSWSWIGCVIIFEYIPTCVISFHGTVPDKKQYSVIPSAHKSALK